MISFSEAYNVVIDNAFSIEMERVDFNSSLGRILAENVISDIDMPPFDKSAMDGYACRLQDTVKELEIVEVIPAGHTPLKKITECRCSKIMTGAQTPEGANCVIIMEETEISSSNKVKYTGKPITKIKNNICTKAEDIKAGDTLLKKGTLIKPQHIAVMSTAGCVNPLVAKRPKVGIITTGSELVEPHEKITGAKIRNSNGHQLIAQVKNCGGTPNYYGIVEDAEEAITEMISKALKDNDLILISGGVSIGDYDFVPTCLKNNGINILFNQVAVQPGKPINFGISKRKACFGMPGNPVSTFIQFELLIKPFIYKMMGADFSPVTYQMPLGEDYSRKNDSRESVIPVKITEGKVYPLEYHGSAHISALIESDYVISIPPGIKHLEKETMVNVRQIQ